MQTARALLPLNRAYLGTPGKKAVFDQAATTAGFTDYAAFNNSTPSEQQINKVRGELEKDASIKPLLAQ